MPPALSDYEDSDDEGPYFADDLMLPAEIDGSESDRDTDVDEDGMGFLKTVEPVVETNTRQRSQSASSYKSIPVTPPPVRRTPATEGTQTKSKQIGVLSTVEPVVKTSNKRQRSPSASSYKSISGTPPLERRTPALERTQEKANEDSNVLYRSSRTSLSQTTSARKKRSLAGLDEENIIQPGDDVSPAPFAPKSSYRTRAQVHGTQKSEMCYDQGFHPMDQYIRPKQAARVKAKYGIPQNSSFHEAEDADSECETELEDNSKGRQFFPRSSAGTRWSSRHKNRDVLYNMNVHPQDKEIRDMERAQRSGQGPRKRVKIEPEDSDHGYDSDKENRDPRESLNDIASAVDLTNEPESDEGRSEASDISSLTNFLLGKDDPISIVDQQRDAPVNQYNGIDTTGHEEDGENFEEQYSGGIYTDYSEPVGDDMGKDMGRDNGNIYGAQEDFDGPPNIDGGPSREPIRVWEQPLSEQLLAEETAPPPTLFNDDDKENNPIPVEREDSPDPRDYMTIRPAPVSEQHRPESTPHCGDSYDITSEGYDTMLELLGQNQGDMDGAGDHGVPSKGGEKATEHGMEYQQQVSQVRE